MTTSLCNAVELECKMLKSHMSSLFSGGDAEAWCSGWGFDPSVWLHVLCMACHLRIFSVSFQVDRHNVRGCRKVGFDNSRVAEGGASWKTPQRKTLKHVMHWNPQHCNCNMWCWSCHWSWKFCQQRSDLGPPGLHPILSSVDNSLPVVPHKAVGEVSKIGNL